MINLLPAEEKSVLITRYRLRAATVALVLAASLFVLFTMMLLPSYFMLRYASPSAYPEGESKEASSVGDKEKTINAVNNILETLSPSVIAKGKIPPSPSVILAVLLGARDEARDKTGASLALRSISYEWKQGLKGSAKKTPVAVQVRGTAGTREALREYVLALEDDPAVAEVNAPVANFLSEYDAFFDLSITFVAL